MSKNQIQKLRDSLDAHFLLTPPTNLPRIRDAITADNWGVEPKDFPVETWTNWKEISDELLEQGRDVLFYFHGQDLTYYMPRFIERLLTEFESGKADFSSISGNFVSCLASWRQNAYRELALSPEQRRILEEIYELAYAQGDLKPSIDFVEGRY